MLFNINDTSGDSKLLAHIQYKLMEEFNEPLVGAEFGVAYGGGIEQVCSIWKPYDLVYGYDTFEGHPTQLASNAQSPEATAMQGWYDQFGKEKLSKEYIEERLHLLGYKNFQLVKGLVDANTPKPTANLHYVLLDLDLVESMKSAYNLVKSYMRTGGYLCLHDVIPNQHMPSLYSWWFFEDKLNLKLEYIGKYLVVYKVK
jgi:hypothetical protein